MKSLLRLVQFAVVLAIAVAPILLHLGVVAPVLVTNGLRGLAVVSLVGAVVWFALWLQALPGAKRPPSCSTCLGRKCATPEACQLPVARATRPPRLAMLVHWAWVRARIALLRWNLECIGGEREYYSGLGMVGPLYLRASYQQQRVLMSRIRELEAQL
jgi:hypothetical protein